MLCLSRKPGETITIGDDVRVTVISVSGKQVRIGIEAPQHIEVHREEIKLKIDAENAATVVASFI